LARQNVAGSGRCETAVPARPCHADKPSQPPQPCVWPWRPSRAARRAPLDLPTRAARRGKHAARRCRGLEALRRCLEPLERYPRALLHNGGLQRCERRWKEVIPALAGTPLLEGLKRGRKPASVLRWTFRNRPSNPADSGAAGSVTNRKAAARAFRVPPIAQRTSSWIPAASAENPLVVPACERAGPRVCSLGLGFIRPARPSKRASVAVWAVSGGRRRLRKPHRRASGSSSARAHEAAQKPPAHRSSGVP
jgi:hypothetical protein